MPPVAWLLLGVVSATSHSRLFAGNHRNHQIGRAARHDDQIMLPAAHERAVDGPREAQEQLVVLRAGVQNDLDTIAGRITRGDSLWSGEMDFRVHPKCSASGNPRKPPAGPSGEPFAGWERAQGKWGSGFGYTGAFSLVPLSTGDFSKSVTCILESQAHKKDDADNSFAFEMPVLSAAKTTSADKYAGGTEEVNSKASHHDCPWPRAASWDSAELGVNCPGGKEARFKLASEAERAKLMEIIDRECGSFQQYKEGWVPQKGENEIRVGQLRADLGWRYGVPWNQDKNKPYDQTKKWYREAPRYCNGQAYQRMKAAGMIKDNKWNDEYTAENPPNDILKIIQQLRVAVPDKCHARVQVHETTS